MEDRYLLTADAHPSHFTAAAHHSPLILLSPFILDCITIYIISNGERLLYSQLE